MTYDRPSADHSATENPATADPALAALGWSPAWAATAAADPASAHPGARPGRVARVDRGHCVVHAADGAVHAPFAPDLTPVTGDWVVLGPDDRALAVLPRRTALNRGAGRTDTRGQTLAANVDVVGVVQGLSSAPNLARIERFLALAWSSGAVPVVVLSKADLVADPESERAEVAAACPGAEVVAVSTVPGHPAAAGLDALRALLPAGTTGCLVGPSGVGKSSLVNAFVGADVLLTRDIRDDGKGRHTSVTRELVPLPWGALLIDTPGLRGVQLWDAEEGLEATFGDVVELTSGCRFNDCAHGGEPGCAVRAAIDDGTLPLRRWESYQKLQREQDWLAMRYDARLRAEQRAVWKRRTREARHRIRP